MFLTCWTRVSHYMWISSLHGVLNFFWRGERDSPFFQCDLLDVSNALSLCFVNGMLYKLHVVFVVYYVRNTNYSLSLFMSFLMLSPSGNTSLPLSLLWLFMCVCVCTVHVSSCVTLEWVTDLSLTGQETCVHGLPAVWTTGQLHVVIHHMHPGVSVSGWEL